MEVLEEVRKKSLNLLSNFIFFIIFNFFFWKYIFLEFFLEFVNKKISFGNYYEKVCVDESNLAVTTPAFMKHTMNWNDIYVGNDRMFEKVKSLIYFLIF